MKIQLSLLCATMLLSSAALAQNATPAPLSPPPEILTPTAPVAAPTATINANSKVPPVAQLLAQGFEIKAGFFDASSVAYLALQKGKEAYLCHAGNLPGCDKLN